MGGFPYAPATSPVIQLLGDVGLHLDPLRSGTQTWTIGNVAIWTYAGFNCLIFLTGLSAIDPSLLEAARIDGAGRVRIALRIKLPLLMPSIMLALIFNLIGTLQLFTEPTVLRSITNAISSRWSPSMFAYAEAAGNRYSYAAAISTVLALATALLSFALLYVPRRLGRSR